jgi:hypothetical protein
LVKFKLKIRTWIFGVVCLGVLLYVGVRVAAESSDGYKFLDQAIRRAPQIQSRLGQIESVQLSYIGGVRLRAVASQRWVTLTLNVVGNKGAAKVVASAERRGGVWSVTAASLDGEPIALN